jgi:hypothetical protein
MVLKIIFTFLHRCLYFRSSNDFGHMGGCIITSISIAQKYRELITLIAVWQLLHVGFLHNIFAEAVGSRGLFQIFLCSQI